MPHYIFNPITLQYEPYEGPRYARTLRLVLALVTAAALCYLYFWIYTSVLGWDLPKTAHLKKEAEAWEAKMSLVNRRLDLYETTLEGVEERDDHVYRSIFGLGEIPPEAKTGGLADPRRHDALLEEGASPRLKSTLVRLDGLSKRSYLQSVALDEVGRVALTAGDMISHIPAVPPILPDRSQYHLASTYGYRTDPVYGGLRFHAGQDFAAHKGYPVYATGDGKVIATDFRFTGYGNEIEIDHGFGYHTRYAHLSRIDVAPGMQVRRGQLIGAVGSTGKSTGPHLHYEIIYRGSTVNPWSYMDLNMSVEEYRAMVSQRSGEESPRKKSTLELLSGRGSRR